MPKRISKPKRPKPQPEDVNQLAYRLVQESTAEPPAIDRITLSRVMAEMGRKGGKIGGKKSLKTMTKAERKKRAERAAKARWKRA